MVYIWPIYQSFDKRISFTVFFFSSQRELHPVLNFNFFLLLNYDLFCPNWSYQNVLQVFQWKIVTIPLVLFYQFFFIWLFEKFILELEVSYSFQIVCILVRQDISLKNNGGVIGKICLVSWSPICTLLILVSALMNTPSTSTTVVYSSMRVDTPRELLI